MVINDFQCLERGQRRGSAEEERRGEGGSSSFALGRKKKSRRLCVATAAVNRYLLKHGVILD